MLSQSRGLAATSLKMGPKLRTGERGVMRKSVRTRDSLARRRVGRRRRRRPRARPDRARPQAPRALWRRFAPMVFRMLKRALGPGHDVEDLAQEVFLCVFEKVPALREPKALKAFVISITVLTTRSELRRLWVRRWIRLSRTRATRPAKRWCHAGHRLARGARPFLRGPGPRQRQDRTLFVLRFMEGLGCSRSRRRPGCPWPPPSGGSPGSGPGGLAGRARSPVRQYNLPCRLNRERISQ